MNKPIYFDNAATTPICDAAAKAMHEAIDNAWGNPSSTHAIGRKSKTLIEKARRTFAKDFDVLPSEIYFTSGATESIMLGMYSACMEGVTHIITSATEHKAVLDISEQLSRQFSISRSVVDVDKSGAISLNQIEALLKETDGKALISIMYVNNETGVENPVESIGALAKTYDALFFCDCVQAGLYHAIKPELCGIDYLSLSAHKLYGPKGIGLLYINNKREKHALWQGGSQERGYRSGTENVPGILGFEAAWKDAQSDQSRYLSHVKSLNSNLKIALQQIIPNISFNGANTSPHICHISIPTEKTPSSILLQCDISGIALSAGSACQSGSHKRSHVVEAMNIPKVGVDLRVSIGRQNTEDDIAILAQTLGDIFDMS